MIGYECHSNYWKLTHSTWGTFLSPTTLVLINKNLSRTLHSFATAWQAMLQHSLMVLVLASMLLDSKYEYFWLSHLNLLVDLPTVKKVILYFLFSLIILFFVLFDFCTINPKIQIFCTFWSDVLSLFVWGSRN